MSELSMKECTICHRSYQLTPENWYWVWHRTKQKKYPESRCKSCSKERRKAWSVANREKLRARMRLYDKSPKGIYKKLKQSGRSWEVKMSQEEFSEWYQSQPKICCYCGIPEGRLRKIPDKYNNKTYRLTVDRLDSSKHYELTNIALCCLRCNHIKGDFFTPSEMVEIGQRYIASKWRTSNGDNQTP